MSPTRILSILFALALPVYPPSAHSQAPPNAALQVDGIFEPWNTVHMPGCAVGVAHNGLTVLSRAYGMADLEHGVPNKPETIFEGGSVSKQFTAAAIVLLALDGKLALNDDVRTYVPEVPDYGTPVTLKHMLTHTSGLRDWGSVAGISGWGRQNRTHTHAHVLDIVSRQSALNFEPGREYSYSNTGYNLLAIVVSRVSGMAFAEFSKQRIFEPLGLEHTQWRDDHTRIVKGRSTAYAVRGDDVSIMRPIEDVHGNGGILTTVGDLLVWNEALTDGRLGGPEFLTMMHDRGRLNDGRQIPYASGLRVSTFAGVPSITHTGSTSGYRAFLGRYPEQKLSVAMLCNASNVSTGSTGGRIARVFLGDAARDEIAPEGAHVPTAVLASASGLYRDTRTGDPVRLILRDGVLRISGRGALIPMSATEFWVGNGDQRFTLENGDRGRPSIRVTTGPYEDSRFEPVDPFEPDESQLREYEGRYYSADAETTLTLSVQDGRLVGHRRPDSEFAMSPIYRDAFQNAQYGIVHFHRDDNGRITALGLRLPRVYDMRFERVQRR